MNILVPTDFSKAANAAVQYAAMLSSKLGAKIILMHIIPPRSMWWRLTDDHLVIRARQKQEKIKTTLVNQGLAADSIELRVFNQFPVNEWINDFVRKNKIDFAVIGTSGSGLKHDTIGSFASGVINHLTAPVFAIPPGFKLKPITHILYPVDLQDPGEDVNIVVRIAKMFDAFIHLVHISKKRTDESLTAAETLHKIAGKMGYEKVTTSVKAGGKIEALIIESIQEENADLLVMFPKAKGFFEQVFHGSITEEISHNITIPLLTIQQIKPGTYREHADF